MLSSICLILLSGCGKERLVVENGVVQAGADAYLWVRAESLSLTGLHSAISGRCLEGFLEEGSTGHATTGPDGWARIPLGVLAPGGHSLRVEGRGGRPEIEVSVHAARRGRPVVVCDVDETLYRSGGFQIVAIPESRPERAIRGAVDVLGALSERFTIVYLTAREEAFRTITRKFLKAGGFPAGPLIMWDISRDPVSRLLLKSRRLEALKALWPWLTWGIGDRDTDRTAYRAVGMKVILLEPGLREEWRKETEGVWKVREWSSVPGIMNRSRGGKPGGSN